MPQDAFTLKFLCEELNTLFCGGKINRIIQPDNEQVILTIYTGKKTEKLLLDVNPANPRVGVTEDDFDSPLTAPNFCMLLRKHLLSATIEHISIVGFDRIVKIDILPSNELFDSTKKVLYIELMGRYSNIILTENGKVLGGNRGVNFFDNGVRPLIVNREYLFPPVYDKKHPTDEKLIEVFNDESEKPHKLILENVQGISQSTALEIENKYNQEKCQNFSGERLFETLNDFIYKREKNPCVLLENGCVKDVFAFQYKTVLGEYKYFPKLYLAEEFYFKNKLILKKTRELKNRLFSVVNASLKKTKKKLVAIMSRYNEAENAEQNRIKGELILSNIYKLKGGEEKVVLQNYYTQTDEEIILNPNLSPSKNAENYYKKYNKQKRALSMLETQLQGVREEENYLESLMSEITLATSLEDLKLVKEELIEAGLIKEKNITGKKKKEVNEYREYCYLGYTIRVGRNNLENDKLTLSAKKGDIWLHSKNYHSSHVVIESNGGEVPQKVILVASEICAYYSKARDGGKSEVVFTLKKNVKKPSKSKPGFFTYNEYNSILVSPNSWKEYLNN